MENHMTYAYRSAVVVVLALVIVLAAGVGRSAHAADFTVDSTADATDVNPGDGVCDDGAGNCTLRAVIEETNAVAGADTITLPAGTYTLTIAGGGEDAAASGDLDITDDLTLNGAGAASTTIDGGGLDRVLHVDPASAGITVGISGVTIRNGNSSGSGGGIDIGGTLTLNSSIVSGNTAAGDGGGINGAATLSNSTVRDNVANNGGGISGAASLTNSTVSGNTVAGEGGGIWVLGGTATVTNSTVSGNVAGFQGGGGISNNGTLTLTNSTVSGNTAGRGGGIFTTSTLTLANSTVSNNTGDPGQGGGIRNDGGMATLKNTVVANGQVGADCSGAITSSGHNLDGDGTCGLGAAGDLPNTDPQLGSLAGNGGPTQTQALLPASPAIDAGPANAAECPAADQRGIGRPVDGDGDGNAVCDIGAYEAPYVAPEPPTPTQPAGGNEPPSGGGGGDEPTPSPTPGASDNGPGSDSNGGGWLPGLLIGLLVGLGMAGAAAAGFWFFVVLPRRRRQEQENEGDSR